MKITWKHGNRSIEFEHQPMQPERFTALCKLTLAVIGGAVLVALVHMIGGWALIWALVGVVLVWLCKLYKEDF